MSFENAVDVVDHEVMRAIPSDYWLKAGKTRCLLACMVHQTNKEIGSNCSTSTGSVKGTTV